MKYFNGEADSGSRGKRFIAFVMDAIIVVALSWLVYHICGQPDFYSVKENMDAIKEAGGSDPELTARVMAEFSKSYMVLLIIAFVYESVVQLLTKGSTLGKMIMGIRVVSVNPVGKPVAHAAFLCLRSFLKMLALYLFNGIPFIICYITMFTNSESRSGFDMAAKTRVVSKG